MGLVLSENNTVVVDRGLGIVGCRETKERSHKCRKQDSPKRGQEAKETSRALRKTDSGRGRMTQKPVHRIEEAEILDVQRYPKRIREYTALILTLSLTEPSTKHTPPPPPRRARINPRPPARWKTRSRYRSRILIMKTRYREECQETEK